MNAKTRYTAWMMMIALGTATAMAGQASTSASADNARGGSADATANYIGGSEGFGFARTDTDTGRVNMARGVAVGFDGESIDLSLSHAIASRLGPAYAGTFNLSIGRDGQVAGSYGNVMANGGRSQSVEAGGSTGIVYGQPISTAIARGDTSGRGEVKAVTRSYNTGSGRTPVIVHQRVPSRFRR